MWEAYAFAALADDGCSFHNKGFFEPAKNWKLIEYATSAVRVFCVQGALLKGRFVRMCTRRGCLGRT